MQLGAQQANENNLLVNVGAKHFTKRPLRKLQIHPLNVEVQHTHDVSLQPKKNLCISNIGGGTLLSIQWEQ